MDKKTLKKLKDNEIDSTINIKGNKMTILLARKGVTAKLIVLYLDEIIESYHDILKKRINEQIQFLLK